MNNADALWQVHGTGSTIKDRDLMPESEQPVGNRKSEETRSPKDQYAQGFSLPPVTDRQSARQNHVPPSLNGRRMPSACSGRMDWPQRGFSVN